MEEERGGVGGVCRLQARACAEAVALDASVPRPGLTSVTRPRPGHEPLGFIGLTGLAYEACLCSCLRGAGRRPGWTGCWLEAVREMAARWGNTGMGMLFLLSLQSHAVGQAAGLGRADRDEAVMGASRLSLEGEGVEGAVAFYRGLAAAHPSYLWRLSWAGLPDASAPGLALAAVREGRVTLARLADAAGLYDPVLRDAARLLSLSLGYLAPLMLEEAARLGLVEALRLATLEAAAVFGDLLVARKLGLRVPGIGGQLPASVEARLWRLMRQAGPGSAADLAAAAAARLLLLSWLGVVELHAYPRRRA